MVTIRLGDIVGTDYNLKKVADDLDMEIDIAEYEAEGIENHAEYMDDSTSGSTDWDSAAEMWNTYARQLRRLRRTVRRDGLEATLTVSQLKLLMEAVIGNEALRSS